MSTFKRLGLSVLLFCTLTAAAGAGTASADFAATGAFTFDAGATRLTVNGTSNYVQCSVSQATGNAATVSPSLSFRLVFTGTCITQLGTSATLTCANPTSTLTGSNFTSTTADVVVEFTGSCTMVLGSNLCTITMPSAASLPWAVPGTAIFDDTPPATLTLPSLTTVPFTSAGNFCGLIGYPSSGAMTYAPPGGGTSLVYTQTAGTAVDVTP